MLQYEMELFREEIYRVRSSVRKRTVRWEVTIVDSVSAGYMGSC